MKQPKHWQDVINAVIGLWLLGSPWTMDFSHATTPSVNAVMVGVALVAAALGAIVVPRAWEEWSEAALGMWLMASPWILGFSAMADARVAALAAGLVVAVLAFWTLANDRDHRSGSRDRVAH